MRQETTLKLTPEDNFETMIKWREYIDKCNHILWMVNFDVLDLCPDIMKRELEKAKDLGVCFYTSLRDTVHALTEYKGDIGFSLNFENNAFSFSETDDVFDPVSFLFGTLRLSDAHAGKAKNVMGGF